MEGKIEKVTRETRNIVDLANQSTNVSEFIESTTTPLEYKCDEFTFKVTSYPIKYLPEDLFEWAFNLVKQNVGHFYETSEIGWDSHEKRKEMREPNTRYLIARMSRTPAFSPFSSNKSDKYSAEECVGFLSFQFVWEELANEEETDKNQNNQDDEETKEIEVIYCYEVQLVKSARGKGLGTFLVTLMEDIGRRWGVKKSMLTIFKVNKRAFDFYQHLGYRIDGISPSAYLGPKEGANFDYEILSKVL
ncbi:hypothetical protein G9A89_020698 [Geosiphon pyriformis]|nr:hypothetical protein G9A89_020698 [Geosiphon pyriformis]